MAVVSFWARVSPEEIAKNSSTRSYKAVVSCINRFSISSSPTSKRIPREVQSPVRPTKHGEKGAGQGREQLLLATNQVVEG